MDDEEVTPLTLASIDKVMKEIYKPHLEEVFTNWPSIFGELTVRKLTRREKIKNKLIPYRLIWSWRAFKDEWKELG